LAARAELLPPKVHPGSRLELVIHVRVAPGWHIYVADGSSGPGLPTTLGLVLPEGLKAEGGWITPEPKWGSDGRATYEGDIAFRRHLRADIVAGVVEVRCELAYQACDHFSCRAPARVGLEATAEVISGRSR
jgi:DsbC/DsbD-like thiol-disulfide interchange protein